MNRVGERGKGESVWLGWFLLRDAHGVRAAWRGAATSQRAPPLARSRRRAARLARARGWDGDWYRRGYFDDGTPLGSAASEECRIDSIAQSWAVISGAGDPGRARLAMAAVERRADPPQGSPGAAVHAAVRQDAARSRLHQGLSAGHPRERRPVHPRGVVVGHGLRHARRRRQGSRAVLAAQPDQPRAHARRTCIATRSSPTSSPPTSIPSRLTSGAAAGPGTRARPAGCSGPASRASSGCVSRGRSCVSSRAFRGAGQDTR